jgi:hypothetical protein
MKKLTEKSKDNTQKKTSGDAKGKASFDQNGQGAAPKYGQAGDTPNESGEGMKKKKTL